MSKFQFGIGRWISKNCPERLWTLHRPSSEVPCLYKVYLSESARDNLGKVIYQFQPETKTQIRKRKKILIILFRQNLPLLFNETYLNERLLPNYTHTHTHTHTLTHTHTHTHTHIYIYIYICIYIVGKAYWIWKKRI